ncbi:MAG: EcsC family protein [Nocardioides sp.]|uniref:EcsC family protein n=1 Tax=Nocardioides sp. TaxID=35761 RepID=UPI0039E2B8C8
MVKRRRALTAVAGAVAPKLIELTPGITTGVIRQALHRAIVGVGPLPGAAAAAEKQLAEQHGAVEKAIGEVIENHVALASAGGFVTNLGGLITAAFTIPANVSGLAVIQCRMVAGIAHLRGYDLTDPRVRNAVLLCLLGSDRVNQQIKRKRLAAPPMAVATAPVYDAGLDSVIGAEVAAEMLARITGKRLAATLGRRVPVVGGVVGAGTDAWATYQIGRYTSRELLPRTRR